jgi:hypothetical protein
VELSGYVLKEISGIQALNEACNIHNKPLVITTVNINPGVVFPCLDNLQIICGTRPIRNEDIKNNNY